VLEHGLGDEVLFIPAAHSPLKDDVPHATGEQRLAMLELAIQDALAQKKSYKRQECCAPEMVQKRDAVTGELVVNVHTGEKVMVENTPTIEVECDYQLSISDIELHREGKSYTIDTLNILKKAYRDYDISFMIGSDCIAEISEWKRYGELLQQFGVIVYPRPNAAYCPRTAEDRGVFFKQLSEEIGAHFAAKLVNAMLDPADFPELDVSSTELRQAIVAGGDLSAYLSPSVWQYIQTNKLYTSL
jgi:nicotinate (nicotinamide) nucleotide adenylyltransferase